MTGGGSQHIGLVALMVRNYDEAIAFYTRKLRFRLIEDTALGPDKRWVVLAPPGASETRLLLARAANPQQRASVGNQAGGRVFLFLETSDFHGDYQEMLANGVIFREPPRNERYGTVAVFEDLYGNRWDLLQRAPVGRGALTPPRAP